MNEFLATLYTTIGVLVLIIVVLIVYLIDKSTKQTNNLGKQSGIPIIMGKTEEELINNLIESELPGFENLFEQPHPSRTGAPSLLNRKHSVAQMEFMRRLILELRNFDKTTTLFSFTLIILALVQIFLAVLQLAKG